MGDDPVWDKPKLTVVGSNKSLAFTPARLPDPTTIPPRRWLYGNALLREHVSFIVAPGGTGKSMWALIVAVSIATGRELLGEHIFERCNVAVLNLEDPLDELERRLAAIMLHYGIRPEELEGRLFLNSGDQREVKIAAWGEGKDGRDQVVYPDAEALLSEIASNNVGLLIVDPFSESHDLEENSNPEMVQASKAWRRVARNSSCAILLAHHVRKGTVDTIDAARGAKALTDAARVGLLMTSMPEDVASKLEIPEEDRGRFVRIHDAKMNLAPKDTDAKWMRMETVRLGNSTPTYPRGDNVAVLASWTAPTLFANISAHQCNEALDAIDRGPRAGVRYCAHRRGRDNSRWAGTALTDTLRVNETRASSIIGAWLKNRLLVERAYHDAEQRKERTGLFVDNTKRPTEGRHEGAPID